MIRTSDDFDQQLNGSAPPRVALTAEIESELAVMSVAARGEEHARPPRRRLTPLATVGVAAAVMFAGAGAAAAAGVPLFSWTGWEQSPDRAYGFTLPSGETCEMRLGDVTGDNAEMVQAVRDYLATVDLDAALDVPAAITLMREDTWTYLDDGSLVFAGYGTEFYPEADQEYQDAVSNALTRAIQTHVESEGLIIDDASWANLAYSGRTQCGGSRQ